MASIRNGFRQRGKIYIQMKLIRSVNVYLYNLELYVFSV